MGQHFIRIIKSRLRRFVYLSAIAIGMVNCSNIYEPMSPKDTNDAYYETATKALNSADYDTAITNFGRLTSGYLNSKVEIRQNYAGALAGKCGLVFSTFYNSISTANFATTPFFKVMMNQFTQKTVYPTYCTLAEAQIKAIWAGSTATSGQQLFMVMLSMAKMGSYLRNKADVDSTGSLGDGSADALYDSCVSTDDANHLTDTEMKEIVTGFSLMLLNVTSFSATLGLGATVTAIDAVCQALPVNPCTVTDSANVTAPMINSMRDLLSTDATNPTAAFGVGTCVDPLVDPCCP